MSVLAGAGTGAVGLAGLLLALVTAFVLADRLGLAPVGPGRVRHLSIVLAALLPLEALLVGAVLAWLARRTPFEAAAEADRRFDLADRFASALALAGRDRDPMVAALLDDAVRATGAVDGARLHPVPSPARAALAAAFVAAALALSRLASPAPPAPAGDPIAMAPVDPEGRLRKPGPAGDGEPGAPGVAEGAPAEGESEGGEGDGGEGSAGGGEAGSQPQDEGGQEEDGSSDNPGERPGDQLFAEPERAPAPLERIDLPSLFSPGRPVSREAMVRETTPGEGGVPGPGKTVLTAELHQEFRRVAEAEIRSPRRTEADRDLVRRYFERIDPQGPRR